MSQEFRIDPLSAQFQDSDMNPNLEWEIKINSSCYASGAAFCVEDVSYFWAYSLTKLPIIIPRNVFRILKAPSVSLNITCG